MIYWRVINSLLRVSWNWIGRQAVEYEIFLLLQVCASLISVDCQSSSCHLDLFFFSLFYFFYFFLRFSHHTNCNVLFCITFLWFYFFFGFWLTDCGNHVSGYSLFKLLLFTYNTLLLTIKLLLVSRLKMMIRIFVCFNLDGTGLIEQFMDVFKIVHELGDVY